jgi:hypothetical protein
VLTALALAWLVLSATGVVVALGWAVELRDRRRLGRVVRQVAVTEAVHRELGALVAPVVSRRPGAPWTVSMAVGSRELALAGRLTAIARRVVGRDGSPVRVVLLPRDPEEARPAMGRALSRAA